MPTPVRKQTLRTEGIAEMVRAADAAGGELKKQVRAGLRRSAEPVRDTVRQLLADKGVSSRTVTGVGISVRRTGIVSVEQRRRRTTGKRRKFGGFQMVDAFIPGLQRNEAATVRNLEMAVEEAADVFESRGVGLGR